MQTLLTDFTNADTPCENLKTQICQAELSAHPDWSGVRQGRSQKTVYPRDFLLSACTNRVRVCVCV